MANFPFFQLYNISSSQIKTVIASPPVLADLCNSFVTVPQHCASLKDIKWHKKDGGHPRTLIYTYAHFFLGGCYSAFSVLECSINFEGYMNQENA